MSSHVIARRDLGVVLLLALTALALAVTVGSLIAHVGRPYPGFLVTPDYRVAAMDEAARRAGLEHGDRVVTANGATPLRLLETVASAGERPVRYEVERAGRRLVVDLRPAPYTARLVVDRFGGYVVVSVAMLAVGLAVFAQNRSGAPNRRFLAYMCLWSMSNLAVPEATLGPARYAAALVGVVPVLLVVHGWIVFLTYPVNAGRAAWLERHRVIPRLYRAGLATALAITVAFAALYALAPEQLVNGWAFRAIQGFQVALALLSFPIKVGALLATRRQAASPLVDQQALVLMLGIGFGLGAWLLLMLLPLAQYYPPPVDPQWGSAAALLYPLAIAYATVRYRLFDATVVIRRSVVYTGLAGLITGAYALCLAVANALLAQTDWTRSAWFSAGFMFVVALAFNPLREALRRAVDRTFFRQRYDFARAIQALARELRSLLDLDEIGRRLPATIQTTMQVATARLVLEPPAAVVAALESGDGALTRYQLAADPRFGERAGAALSAFAGLGAEAIVPLSFQTRLQGVLVLGPKRSDAPYTDEDLALLETLADQAAVAVANAEAHRRVLDYARELERSLMIRTNLAKFVPRRVRQLIEASPEAPSLDKRETDVTVLFTDITGYTRLTSRLAPDDLDALVERYFSAFLDEIVKHGGDVNETAGDGLMVIFHEGEHARLAVEAARGIHRRAAEIGAELAARFEPLVMHIGVNTGPALLGATKIEGRAGTRWTYTASGRTTNIAARLAAQAQGGEIVISDSTRARIGPDAKVEELGVRQLKNVDEPVRLYRLV